MLNQLLDVILQLNYQHTMEKQLECNFGILQDNNDLTQ